MLGLDGSPGRCACDCEHEQARLWLRELLMVICRRVKVVCNEVQRLIDGFWLGSHSRCSSPSNGRSDLGLCSCPVGSGRLRWCHLYLAGHVLLGLQVANGSKEPPTASENRLHEGKFCF